MTSLDGGESNVNEEVAAALKDASERFCFQLLGMNSNGDCSSSTCSTATDRIQMYSQSLLRSKICSRNSRNSRSKVRTSTKPLNSALATSSTSCPRAQKSPSVSERHADEEMDDVCRIQRVCRGFLDRRSLVSVRHQTEPGPTSVVTNTSTDLLQLVRARRQSLFPFLTQRQEYLPPRPRKEPKIWSINDRSDRDFLDKHSRADYDRKQCMQKRLEEIDNEAWNLMHEYRLSQQRRLASLDAKTRTVTERDYLHKLNRQREERARRVKNKAAVWEEQRGQFMMAEQRRQELAQLRTALRREFGCD